MLELSFYAPTGKALLHRELEQGRYRIGRSMLSDIRLKHEAVGRHQALLEYADGEWTIRDRDGSPGMRKDGEQINAYGPLSQGDVIMLGECEMHVARAEVLNAYDGAPVHGDAPGEPAPYAPEKDNPGPTGETSVRSDQASSGSRPETGQEDMATDPADHNADSGMHGFGSAAEEEEGVTPEYGGMNIELKSELHDALFRAIELYRRDVLNEMSQEELRYEARQATEQAITNRTVRLPDHVDRELLVEEVVAEAVGHGPLEPLLADPTVTEIMVNGAHRVYAERGGRLVRVATTFTDDQSLSRVIERIVTSVGRRIDEGQPLVDARLPDGSRVNAIIPPLSLIGPCLTIRKFAQVSLDLDDLVGRGSLSGGMAEFLRTCIKYRRNLIVSGGTGSGKTTFLNALSAYIPEGERIVTIEDAAELRLVQDHVISLEARPPNMEGKGEISIRDLVRNALRMRPDRIIVGECRGGETVDMLQAMNTGHEGSLTTAHANTPRDLLSRLEVMVLMAGMDLPVRAIREQIASSLDVIVQQQRLSDGTRRVTSIHEVTGMEGDVVLMQKLFEFQQQSVDAEGRIHGAFQGCGQEPSFYEVLRRGGVDLDRSIFSEQQDQ